MHYLFCKAYNKIINKYLKNKTDFIIAHGKIIKYYILFYKITFKFYTKKIINVNKFNGENENC